MTIRHRIVTSEMTFGVLTECTTVHSLLRVLMMHHQTQSQRLGKHQVCSSVGISMGIYESSPIL